MADGSKAIYKDLFQMFFIKRNIFTSKDHFFFLKVFTKIKKLGLWEFCYLKYFIIDILRIVIYLFNLSSYYKIRSAVFFFFIE